MYARLLEQDPIHWEERLGVWIISSYTAVNSPLLDPLLTSARIGSEERLRDLGLERVLPVFRMLGNMMLFSRSPQHGRVRGVACQAFTPRAYTVWFRVCSKRSIPSIRRLDARGPVIQFDFVSEFARPLPTLIISELIGVLPSEAQRFHDWWRDVMEFVKRAQIDPETHAPASAQIEELTGRLWCIHAALRAPVPGKGR